jgi:hypothetical protein
LDETIDRVAGDVTAVSADSALSDRIRARLADRRRPLFMPVLAAASVAGATVLATALWLQREPAAPAEPALVATAIAPMASLRRAVPGSVTFPDAPSRAGSLKVEGGPTLRGQGGTSAATPEMAVLPWNVEEESTVPAPLTVGEAIVAAVTTPNPVAIAPLDVTPLEVPALDTTYGSKEPR